MSNISARLSHLGSYIYIFRTHSVFLSSVWHQLTPQNRTERERERNEETAVICEVRSRFLFQMFVLLCWRSACHRLLWSMIPPSPIRSTSSSVPRIILNSRGGKMLSQRPSVRNDEFIIARRWLESCDALFLGWRNKKKKKRKERKCSGYSLDLMLGLDS